MTAEISISHLSFTYLKAHEPTLRDVSLEIGKGTVTVFFGQVGAGKSTLFRTLNGLIPTIIPGRLEGDIMVADHNVRGKDTAFLAQFINLVFDDPVLQIVSLTAEEDVAFGPANLNLPREEVWARVQNAMERVRLRGFGKRNPRSMSGGEQQLLALAGVLAMRPRIIALDEPVAMLDPVGKTMVLEAVRELSRSYGATILIAESGSDIEAVCEFADQMVLMHGGRVLATGRPSEVLARRNMVEEAQLKVPEVTRLAWELDPAKNLGEVPVTQEAGRRFVAERLVAREQHGPALAPNPHGESATGSPSLPTDGGGAAIQVENLHHVFPTDPPVRALRGINLSVEKGDFVCLLGQNGSGKTTLSFHLVGVEKPTNPDAVITVDGLDVRRSPLSQTVRRINYLFQDPAKQLFCETFGQEVAFGPQALGTPRQEAERQGRMALRQVGLEHLWGYYTLGIAKSLETLLSLASVLAMGPHILIADEPTGGLDFATGEKVMEILADLNHQGRTIIVITHDMELAAKYARRIVVLRSGEIWMDGSPREVFGQPERLAQTRLYPPQITRLAQSLAEHGFPPDVLTVDEFVTLMKASPVTSERR